jgi:glutaminase
MRHPFKRYVDEVYERHRECHEGEVASYIPELGYADPNWFAIAVMTADGHAYLAGDWNVPFSIQSISKPFVYGLALEDHGLEYVSRRVGVEPSGDAFNSISLDPHTGRPFNPMINAGAITSTGMVRAESPSHRFERILNLFAGLTGHPMRFDKDVFRSESASGFRNRAIANLLRNFDMIEGEPDDVLEVYFRQCAILTDCRDLAVMAATLATGGICPQTGERVMSADCVRNTLSVMATCGMYDFAGEWIFRVGMPAKSGVAGGVIGVLPGQFGVAVFSPPLDTHGNSVRGVGVFKDLATMLGLHMFNQPGRQHTFIRSRYDATQVRSKRVRPVAQARTLQREGTRIGIWGLQGYLLLFAMEMIVRNVLAHGDGKRYLVFDLRRVTGIDRAAAEMLVRFAVEERAHGTYVLFTHVEQHPLLAAAIEESRNSGGGDGPHGSPNADAAIEWCETHLLEALNVAKPSSPHFGLFDIVKTMTPEQLATLKALIREGSAKEGELIVREGDVADGVYFLMEGVVSVTIEGAEGRPIRVSTLSPAMTFGEMALLDEQRRSASVRADNCVRYLLLTVAVFRRLQSDHPDIAIKLLGNLARGLSDKLRRANEEIAVLSD